jgi:hypothetical protein
MSIVNTGRTFAAHEVDGDLHASDYRHLNAQRSLVVVQFGSGDMKKAEPLAVR